MTKEGSMLELPISQEGVDEPTRLHANVPLRVVIAFDQLTADEKRAVLGALWTLQRGGLQGAPASLGIQMLAGPEPLYSFRAAPEVQVIVRVEPDASVGIVDIVRPAALRNFAHVAG